MEIHISRGEDQSGPFTLEQVQDYLAQGILLPDDLAWHKDLDGWIPLSELAASKLVSPPPPQDPIHPEPAVANAPVKAGSKKKLMVGLGAGVAVLAIAAGAWFMLTPEKGVQAKKNPDQSKPVSPNTPNPNPQIDKLTPEEVANLFADDIGKWKIIGKGKPEGGDPVPFEDIIEVRWRVEGKSTVATFSPMINGEKVFFVGHKEYDAKEGVFIWRSKGVELPEIVSREHYDPATKTYSGKSTLPDGAEETSTFEIVSKDKRFLKTKFEVDGKVVFSREAVFTRMNENRPVIPKPGSGSLVKNTKGEKGFKEEEKFEPTIQGMKEARSWPLSLEEKVFVGRWKESDPELPNDPPFEAIWREDHTFSILYLYADENGKIEERDLTHGIWKLSGKKLYFLDLISKGTKPIPMEEQEIFECDLKRADRDGYAFEVREEGELTKIRSLPVERFTQPEMQPFNTPKALKGFDLSGGDAGPAVPAGKLSAKQVADFFAEDIGTWKIKGGTVAVHPETGIGKPQDYEHTMEIRWKEEGKSIQTSYSSMIEGKQVTFVGRKEYDAEEGVFIYRNKGEGLPENVSRETYDPQKKIYRGHSSFPDGAKATSTFEVVNENKRLFKQQVKADGKVVFLQQATFTRIEGDEAEPNAPAGKLTAEKAVEVMAWEIGKWDTHGQAKQLVEKERDGLIETKFETVSSMECAWKEEGKSLEYKFSMTQGGQTTRFFGRKHYDAAKGVFIYRQWGERMPESISHERYDLATQTFYAETAPAIPPAKIRTTAVTKRIGNNKTQQRLEVRDGDQLVYSHDIVSTRVEGGGAEPEPNSAQYTILDTLADNFDRRKAESNVEDALAKHPDVDAMVGLFEYNPPAILKSLKKANQLGKVKVVGFDENDATLQAIKDGTLYGTVVHNPYQLGYKSIEVLNALKQGNDRVIPKAGIIDVPARAIRQNNVEQFQATLKEHLKGRVTRELHKDKPRFAFVSNGLAQFWRIASIGTDKAADEFGVNFGFHSPTKGVQHQNEILRELMAKGIDGIAVSPIDPAGQKALLQEIARKTILITQDVDAPGSNRRAFIGMDNYEAGRLCGKLVKEALPKGGKVMVFVGRLSHESAKKRQQGLIDELKATDKIAPSPKPGSLVDNIRGKRIHFEGDARKWIQFNRDGTLSGTNKGNIGKYVVDGLKVTITDDKGNPRKAGELLKQPGLAKTYRAIASNGIGWFYGGPFAATTEKWMKANGGIMTARDFSNYKPKLREPVRVTYRGHEIISMPPPSSGGVHVGQILNILENFDLKKTGTNSTDFIHLVTEAMKLAFADRAYWLGDADFVPVPRGLIDKGYAKILAKRIDMTRATRVAKHGTPPRSTEDLFNKHTTHFSCADSEGNWVSCTATVNTSFGSKVIIPGTGVIMNNEMDDFSIAPGVPNAFGLLGAEANAVAPGKRPLSSMSPSIVLKDGKPILAVGAAGGPTIITQTLLAIIHTIDFGLPLKEALAQPHFHHQWAPDQIRIERKVGEKVLTQLRKRGHSLKIYSQMGATQATSLKNGKFDAAHDPRLKGKATSY